VIHHSDLAHMISDENKDQETVPIRPMPALPGALLNLVLYQPEIPQNTGNIGRTCVAIGAKLWLIRPLGFRVDDKSLKRAGMDYWEHLDWEVADSWEDVRKRLPDSQVWFLTKTATRLVWDATFQVGDILLFGSESRGLPASILSQNPASNLKLPMSDLVRSLNLASTANTVAYEAVRQFGGLKF
jgi:tRNA (cytidine/uridine-2'-O-)-methyltransferase